jgi:hypothetical protein
VFIVVFVSRLFLRFACIINVVCVLWTFPCFICVFIAWFLSRTDLSCALPVMFVFDFYPERPLVLFCLCAYFSIISIQSVTLLCFAYLLWVSIQSVPLLCFACLLWVSIKTVPLICFACLYIFLISIQSVPLLCFIYLLLVSIKILSLLFYLCVYCGFLPRSSTLFCFAFVYCFASI